MFYQLSRYKNCHLDNNGELQNMLLLDKLIGVERIDVVVDQKLGIDRHSSLANPYIENEDQTNLLCRYCAHSEKVLLSSVWANNVTHVGQCFTGEAFEFRTILCKYAMQCGFKFKYLKNDSERINIVCSHRDNRGCLWDRPLTRPTNVAFTFKADYGLDISYHVARLGVEKVRKAMHGDYLTSFDLQRWYGDAIQHYNPGNDINIDYDLKTSQFKRFFVAFAAFINGFKYCRLLLFLIGTFLKERYKRQLLVATAKDGNQGLFPVTFVIADSDSESNWSWFLYELSKVIANNNFRDKLKGMKNGFKEHLIGKLGDCAYEPTVIGFHALLEELKSERKQLAYNFLSGLEPEYWANAYFR
ncbi:uncharacterized protein LOC114259232 [Camellia sinensis]|uniref:uncharacterized protein LOC114259232 n=1 Tax=Camellia sinensis TaxID=4442 RepID=UPI0010360C0F|nr:uncharacterized protein LOC114259232 [Camellia sinensis]